MTRTLRALIAVLLLLVAAVQAPAVASVHPDPARITPLELVQKAVIPAFVKGRGAAVTGDLPVQPVLAVPPPCCVPPAHMVVPFPQDEYRAAAAPPGTGQFLRPWPHAPPISV